MNLYLKQIELGPLQNFIYLIGCPETRETAVGSCSPGPARRNGRIAFRDILFPCLRESSVLNSDAD